jgi:hypothetical protein
MPVTSTRRIHIAQQFIRFGFGEHVDENAPFYSSHFLTQELTTTEAQAVLPIVQRYNAFYGVTVAGAIGRFRGQVRGWKFGRADAPMLVVTLPYWSHQVEEIPQGAPVGKPISDQDNQLVVDALRQMFMHELDANRFEALDDTGHVFAAHWG